MSDETMITSLQNRRIKEALKLRRRKGRDDQNRFLIDGLREIRQAMAANVTCLEAFVCPALLSAESQAIADSVRSAGCEIVEVNEPVWEKVSYGNRQDGILVVARHAPSALEELLPHGDEPKGNGPILIVDQVEKPGNVGAIFRTATAAGVSAIIASDPQTDLFNPNAIRASLGTIFRMPLAQATAAEALQWIKAQGMPVYVARVDAKQSLYETDLRSPCAVVVGSEAHGVGKTWKDSSLTGILLPMQGPIDSLNVANSAAIIIYEALRQRS